ncbi:urease accessory protein [Niveomyces insectorum RCEF 264]|uniref:Urease accessory protein n=1 Tax=Niveomyces insectorum RCEF 264 TaxID=1081102 RepID=A0A162MNA5_9HYPO|nr:urease accessory protein [Niveomyces insectorum RCEF 264]
MLGWVLKRGLEGGQGASNEADDTRFEQPDTPGPVFAARAFKSALFGTPARPDKSDDKEQPTTVNPEVGKPVSAAGTRNAGLRTLQSSRAISAAPGNTTAANDAIDGGSTPAPLQGILLTPGTATSRRKRVSFGHDVPENDSNKDSKKDFKIDRDGRRPSLFGPSKATERARNRPRTKLVEALENARKIGSSTSTRLVPGEEEDEQKPDQKLQQKTLEENQRQQQPASPVAAHTAKNDHENNDEDDEALWEEVDNAEWDPDVTVDLNEPHSQSGRYWKAQFQRYQEDAKAEMSKLLKYKQLAKSYAKMKDAEAVDMHAKLREEKDKVAKMEGRITELASQIARKRMKGTDRDYQESISNLTRQTALAVQYRNQVKELEAMLQDNRPGDASPQKDVDEALTVTGAFGRQHHQQPEAAAATSPRTQKTLLDTQRELRRARDQAKDLAQAKEEIRRLKTALRTAERRALKSESESKVLAADLASTKAAAEAAAAATQDCEKRAKFAEDERRRKDEELRLLQSKYDSLKHDAKARVGEAEQVLRRKNEQIAELQKSAADAARRFESKPVAAVERDDEIPVAMAAAAAAAAATAASAPSTALEKATRSRRETRSTKHGVEPNPRHGATELDDFALKLDSLRARRLSEPDLPQQKLQTQKLKQTQPSIHILEDESSHFEPPPALATRAQLRETRKAEDRMTDPLRRRRGAEPLRPLGPQLNAGKGAVAAKEREEREEPQTKPTTTATTTTAAAAASDARGIDLVSARFARLGEGSSKRREQTEEPMDSSKCSLPSERAAAAVARIEKRRAERKRALELLRNKENMQPAPHHIRGMEEPLRPAQRRAVFQPAPNMATSLSSLDDDQDDTAHNDLASIDEEIADLEARLQAARQRRRQRDTAATRRGNTTPLSLSLPPPPPPADALAVPVPPGLSSSQQHFLLLLSDSALPLGSFAFSSGLESFLAHEKAAASADGAGARRPGPGGRSGSAALPFVLAAHDAAVQLLSSSSAAAAEASSSSSSSSSPLPTFTAALAALDDTFDATLVCTVGRRASVAQGRALLSIWERAFAPALARPGLGGAADCPDDHGTVDPLRPLQHTIPAIA